MAEDVELADSVSMAMLLVLETLAPTERAVFVLREVFDVGYDEIAEAVDKSPAAVRQIAHRARAHVEARRPPGRRLARPRRDEVTRERSGAPRTRATCRACSTCSPRTSSSSATAAASSRRRCGRSSDADKVIRFLDAVAPQEGSQADVVVVNGAPALRVFLDGELDSIGSLLVEDGLVTGIYWVRNPAKLARLDEVVALTR